MESDSASSEPPNPKQVYNARSSTSNLIRNIDKDEIFQLLTQVKDDFADIGDFFQEVKFDRTPEVIVGFEQQLEDLIWCGFAAIQCGFRSWESTQPSIWGSFCDSYHLW